MSTSRNWDRWRTKTKGRDKQLPDELGKETKAERAHYEAAIRRLRKREEKMTPAELLAKKLRLTNEYETRRAAYRAAQATAESRAQYEVQCEAAYQARCKERAMRIATGKYWESQQSSTGPLPNAQGQRADHVGKGQKET